MFDRRLFIGAGATALGLAALPRLAFAASAGGDRRFLFIIQRGAADGLATIAPIGDPAFASVRSAFAQDTAGGASLDGFFTLHPALAETAKLYAAKQALFVHAVASPYRERSHFDGQNVLESGGAGAYRLKDGWMNRLLGLLPQGEARAIAVSPAIPMALRGTREVSSYAPSALPDASADLMTRVAALYESDSQLHSLWSQAMQTRAMAGDSPAGRGRRQDGAMIGALAAKLLGEGGARVAMIETDGWDTHANQRGRLTQELRNLDSLLAALKGGLGEYWSKTLVVVATEFGRTAAPNGTGGTDHGTGSAAMLLGGAVAGGRVLADWPGLSNGALLEGRDLKPTIGLDALISAAVAQHYALEPKRVMAALFPEGRTAPLNQPLVRA